MQRFSFLFVLLATLAFVGLANATPTVPSGIQYYAAVNITNSQSSATPSPFQQMINITESTFGNYIVYNNNLANFEYFYANGTIIPAWIESNSSGKLITWVKLTPSIPANGKLTIYLGFASKTTNLLSSSGTSGIGEAPQLSSTYAQYDDGASVFPAFYQNFAGTTLSSIWTVSGIKYTVNNGFSATATGADGYIISKNLALNPVQYILDFYGTNFQTSTSSWTAVGMLDGGLTGITSGSGLGSMIVAGYPTASQTNGWQRNSTGSAGLTTSGAMQTVSAPAVWTIMPTSSTTTNFYINYGGLQTVSANADTYPLYEGLIAAGSAGAAYTFTQPVTITWYRVRAYPPNGVMPSVSFGSVQQATSISLSISPNPATYGQSITITATCSVSTDTCAIDYPSLGTHIAQGTGTATYTFNAFARGAGTYSYFYANDLTAGTASAGATLTINKNSTYTLSLTGITTDNLQYSGVNQTATATIKTYHNQLTANLWLNNVQVGSTNTVLTYNAPYDIGSWVLT